MDTRQPESLAVPLLAAAIVALTALDAVPALRGAPLLLLACCAAVQIDRELAHALTARKLYPAAAVMNLVMPIILLHVAYFRAGAASALLELLGCFCVAMYVLVVVAAFLADRKARGLIPALRDLLLAHVLCIVVGGGLACAMLLQVTADQGVSAVGSRLAAAVLAAAWVGGAVESAVRPKPGAEGRQPVRPAADLLGLAAPPLVLAIASAAAGLGAVLPLPHALVLGLLVGIAGWLGRRLIVALRRHTGAQTFRYVLPRQIGMLQRAYEKAAPWGMTEYAGYLALVFPVAAAYLRLVP